MVTASRQLVPLAHYRVLSGPRQHRPHAVAQSGYTLSWWTVDGGGGTFSTGGACTLGGTIGQPDAGQLTGGTYTLGGRFWGGGAAVIHYGLYRPPVVRESP